MEDSPKPRRFVVTIKWVNDVDVSILADLIEYAPTCPQQCPDILQ